MEDANKSSLRLKVSVSLSLSKTIGNMSSTSLGVCLIDMFLDLPLPLGLPLERPLDRVETVSISEVSIGCSKVEAENLAEFEFLLPRVLLLPLTFDFKRLTSINGFISHIGTNLFCAPNCIC